MIDGAQPGNELHNKQTQDIVDIANKNPTGFETYSPETESIEVSNEIDRITLFPTARRVSACGKLDLQDLSRRPLYRVFFL